MHHACVTTLPRVGIKDGLNRMKAGNGHLRLADELDVAPVLHVRHLRDGVAIRDSRGGLQALARLLIQGLDATRQMSGC